MKLSERYTKDYNKWIYEVLGARLDPEQRKVVESVQHNRRTVVRSGHARGKDYVAACCSLAFLYNNIPAKVINTAPTGRQVVSIMMAEISTLVQNAQYQHGLGGKLLNTKITFEDEPNTFLEAFKAQDKRAEAWMDSGSGFGNWAAAQDNPVTLPGKAKAGKLNVLSRRL